MRIGHSWPAAVGASILALLQVVSAATIEVVLDSYSSQLDYQPDSTEGPLGTWNASFTESSWSDREEAVEPGVVAEGVGYHYTTYRRTQDTDPWVGYTFYGTGIEFFGYFGYLGSGPVDSDTLGRTRLSISDGLEDLDPVITSGYMYESDSEPVSIAKASNLVLANYTVQLRVTAGTVSFTHFVVQMEIGGTDSQVPMAAANPTVLRPYTTEDGSTPIVDSNFGDFEGDWAVQQSSGNTRVGSFAYQDSVTVSLGVGNIFMRLNGTSNSDHGVFGIMITPAPLGFDSYKKYWTYTSWHVLETTLFAVGLDPEKEHQMTLTNIQNDGFASDEWGWFDIHSLTLWKVPTEATSTKNATATVTETQSASKTAGGSSSSAPSGGGSSDDSATPVGAIAGGVVGGLVALAVIAGVVKLYKGYTSEKEDVHPARFMDDPESYVTTPFVPDQSHGHGGAGTQTSQMMSQGPYSPVSTHPDSCNPGYRPMSSSEASAFYEPRYTGEFGAMNSNPALANMAAGAMATSHGVNKPLPQPQPHPTLATDSGFHLPMQQGPLVPMPTGEMPPSYDPSWTGSSSVGAPSTIGDPRLSTHMSSPVSARSALPPVPAGAEPPKMGRMVDGTERMGPQ